MPSLSIGRVYGKTFEVLKKRWLSWALLTAVFSAGPAIIFEAIRWQVGVEDDSVLGAMRGMPGEMPITGILAICFNIAAARGVFDFYEARDTAANAWISSISLLFWPCLGLTILINLALMLGFVLLVIPGLFLMTTLAVALPVRVAERKDVDHAMRRSMELTKGSRWQILGVILIAVVAFVALVMINEMLFVGLWPYFGTVVLYPLAITVAPLSMALLPPVIYEELIALRGGRPNSTAEVFA